MTWNKDGVKKDGQIEHSCVRDADAEHVAFDARLRIIVRVDRGFVSVKDISSGFWRNICSTLSRAPELWMWIR